MSPQAPFGQHAAHPRFLVLQSRKSHYRCAALQAPALLPQLHCPQPRCELCIFPLPPFASALPVASLCGLSDALAVAEVVCKVRSKKDATASCHLKNYPFLKTTVHLLGSFQMETTGIHKENKLCLLLQNSYSLMLNACSFLKDLRWRGRFLTASPLSFRPQMV